jgi:hypothetical protein
VKRPGSRVKEAEVRERTSAKKQLGGAGAEEKKRGRPSGKRSDPSFVQTTAYIRAETYKDVRIALLQEDESHDYSELVEELLSDWLKKRK